MIQIKFVKEIDGEKVTIEETNPNFFSLFEREGFKAIKPKEAKQPVELDKETA